MADKKLPTFEQAQREHHFVVVGKVDKRGRIVYHVVSAGIAIRPSGSERTVKLEPYEDHPGGQWLTPLAAAAQHTDDMLFKDLTATLKRRSREVRND